MKTNLEVLIDHLQSEVDHLQSSMDQCIDDWDFDGAKAFKEPLLHTRTKLRVLKNLKDPNYHRKRELSAKVSRMEKSLSKKFFKTDYIDEQSRQRMEEIHKDILRRRIEESKSRLAKLESIVLQQKPDNDKILQLLEGLERNEINEIEFELLNDKIFLQLSIDKDHAEFALMAKGKEKIEYFLFKTTKPILTKLGFNPETYKKQIPNFHETDKIKILEELAIIHFEVFHIFGGEKNIKVE